MVRLLVEGVVSSLPDSGNEKAIYANITFMGGRINVLIPGNLISFLQARLGQPCVFILDSFPRTTFRKSKDGSLHPEVTYSPGKILEIKDKK